MKPSPSSPIGVFDSGIGGLTVVKSVMERLPEEHILYFGDTARVPYGIKSMETVREYALQITDFLLRRNVKMIVIACNTVSAAAEQDVRLRAGEIPVIGVVEAGARVAAEAPHPHSVVGVIGTLATVGSGTYERSIKAIDSSIQVFSKACPLLVPLAEEGWVDNDVALLTLEHYLADFKTKALDALILGCTHYPLFKEGIAQVMGEGTRIIDSADAVADMVDARLRAAGLRNTEGTGGFECFVSDKPQRFQTLAERFLGKAVHRVEIVNVS